MGKKKPDRTIAATDGPAQLYLFVEIASFTDDWADLKLAMINFGHWRMRLHATPLEHPLSLAQAVPEKFAFPTSSLGREKAATIVFYTPFYHSMARFCSWLHGPNRSARTWSRRTTKRSERSSRAFSHGWTRGGICERC